MSSLAALIQLLRDYRRETNSSSVEHWRAMIVRNSIMQRSVHGGGTYILQSWQSPVRIH
jgi:hypothetical protein